MVGSVPGTRRGISTWDCICTCTGREEEREREEGPLSASETHLPLYERGPAIQWREILPGITRPSR